MSRKQVHPFTLDIPMTGLRLSGSVARASTHGVTSVTLGVGFDLEPESYYLSQGLLMQALSLKNPAKCTGSALLVN